MAVKINGKLVSNKDIKKLEKAKPIEKKSIIGEVIYYIEPDSYDLYKGTIIDEIWDKYKVKVMNQNIYKSKDEIIKEIDKKLIKIDKNEI